MYWFLFLGQVGGRKYIDELNTVLSQKHILGRVNLLSSLPLPCSDLEGGMIYDMGHPNWREEAKLHRAEPCTKANIQLAVLQQIRKALRGNVNVMRTALFTIEMSFFHHRLELETSAHGFIPGS